VYDCLLENHVDHGGAILYLVQRHAEANIKFGSPSATLMSKATTPSILFPAAIAAAALGAEYGRHTEASRSPVTETDAIIGAAAADAIEGAGAAVRSAEVVDLSQAGAPTDGADPPECQPMEPKVALQLKIQAPKEKVHITFTFTISYRTMPYHTIPYHTVL
jgi:hypothetical protein